MSPTAVNYMKIFRVVPLPRNILLAELISVSFVIITLTFLWLLYIGESKGFRTPSSHILPHEAETFSRSWQSLSYWI